MINAGLGEAQVNKLLSGLEIPPLNKKTLQRREREVSHKLIEYAEESCKEAAQLEKSVLREKNRYLVFQKLRIRTPR